MSFKKKLYKTYTALLTQAGVVAPVDTILENTLEGVPIWSYDGVGAYKLTLAGAFPVAKTFVSIGGNINDGATNFAMFSGLATANDVNTIFINGYSDGFIQANDIMQNTTIEIRVYP